MFAIPTIRFAERWFMFGLVALFIVVSVIYTVKVSTPRNGETTRSAIVRWRDQLQGLDSGENIYARYTYPNPPIMAIMLRPLAELPPLAGALTWFYLKVGLTLVSFSLAFRLAQESDVPFPPWAKALTVLLCLRPVLGDLMHGNVNLFILFLVVSGLWLYRNHRDIAAGIVLALAVACKITPALFIPYFLWKREWKTLGGMAIGLALFFFIVPGAILGWSENWQLLSSWFNQMVRPFLAGVVAISEHPNQSLPGLIARLMTGSPSFSDFEGDRYVPLAYHNIVDVGAAANWLVKGYMAVFAIMIVAWCRTPTERRDRSALAAEFALIALGMLLFSERTWKHHAVTLLLPFAVLCYRLSMTKLPIERARIIAVLAITAILMASTSTGILPDEWAKLAQVYGAYTWSFILLTGGMVFVLRRSDTAVSYRKFEQSYSSRAA